VTLMRGRRPHSAGLSSILNLPVRSGGACERSQSAVGASTEPAMAPWGVDAGPDMAARIRKPMNIAMSIVGARRSTADLRAGAL
jgi:hypothetical protein